MEKALDMSAWLHISPSRGSWLRSGFLLALLVALFLGTVADTFHSHRAEGPGNASVLLIVTNSDQGSGPATVDADCGIHPGCAAALIPAPLAVAEFPSIAGKEPIVEILGGPVADPEPDHPPIIS